MSNGSHGTMVQQGNLMHVNNAFVESVSCFNNINGNIVISYSVTEGGNTTSIQNIQLNLNRRTIVLNPLGQNMCLCCIQRGMWINAVFSSRMTRSIPPQANAYLIAVQRNPQSSLPPFPPVRPLPPQRPWPPTTPQRPSSVTTARIILIDFDNNYLVTEDPSNINHQIRFIITDTTTFVNRFGISMRFEDLRPGQMARITHANFQTPSIPPQTTAFHIQLI